MCGKGIIIDYSFTYPICCSDVLQPFPSANVAWPIARPSPPNAPSDLARAAAFCSICVLAFEQWTNSQCKHLSSRLMKSGTKWHVHSPVYFCWPNPRRSPARTKLVVGHSHASLSGRNRSLNFLAFGKKMVNI